MRGAMVSKMESRFPPVPGHPVGRPRPVAADWFYLALPELSAPKAVVYRRRVLSEEALSHAVAKAWIALEGNPDYFDSPAHLRNWVKVTAYRKMVDWHRRERRHPNRTFSAAKGGEWLDQRSRRDSPRRWTEDDRQAVFDCLRMLPEAEREILEAYYYEALSDAELARRLYGLPTAFPALVLRVWRRRRQALAHLRQLLACSGISEAA